MKLLNRKTKIITISIIIIALLGVFFVPKIMRYLNEKNVLETDDAEKAYTLYEKNRNPESSEEQTSLPTNPPKPTETSKSSSSSSYESKSGSSNSGGKCLHCHGTGYVKYYSGEYDEGTYGICTSCGGTGRK